jgi:hypothetical protein
MKLDSWNDVPAEMKKTLMEFNGFKLPIVEVKDKEAVILYLNNNMLK